MNQTIMRLAVHIEGLNRITAVVQCDLGRATIATGSMFKTDELWSSDAA